MYLVASNVGGAVGLRANEAVVLVVSGPGDDAAGVTGGDHGAGEALVLGAVNINADDAAVSVGRSGEGAHKGDGLHDRHFWLICFGDREGFLFEWMRLAVVQCCNERVDDITRISSKECEWYEDREGGCTAELES